MGFPLINHPFWGTPIYRTPQFVTAQLYVALTGPPLSPLHPRFPRCELHQSGRMMFNHWVLGVPHFWTPFGASRSATALEHGQEARVTRTWQRVCICGAVRATESWKSVSFNIKYRGSRLLETSCQLKLPFMLRAIS